MPKVTVFVPVYNAARYVGHAVESILAQTFRDFELLVLDDGSTDGSLDTVAGYRDPRIRLERNPANLGIGATRARGLELARGEYLALLDSDDLAHPDRLRQQLAFLESHPDFAVVGTWSRLMDGDGRALPWRTFKKRTVQPLDPGVIDAQLLIRVALRNSSLMARTDVLRAYGYRPNFAQCEDYDLIARVAPHYRLANLPQRLVCVRIHDAQTTRRLKPAAKKTLIGEIARRQLEALGAAFDDEDLERHYFLLPRTIAGRPSHIPHAAYLDWTEDWLERLRTANAASGRYREPAFSQVLGEIWAIVCWRAWRHGGARLRAWRRFARSPWRRPAMDAARRWLRELALRPMPE